MTFEYPMGLTGAQASKLITTADNAIFEGVAKSGRTSVPIKKCGKCGVKFASNKFNYCPMCAVKPKKIQAAYHRATGTYYEKGSHLAAFGCAIAVIFFIASLVVFVAGCIEVWSWF